MFGKRNGNRGSSLTSSVENSAAGDQVSAADSPRRFENKMSGLSYAEAIRKAQPMPVRQEIQANRDKLHQAGMDQKGHTVFGRNIISPIVAHGSHLIYAPDEIFIEVLPMLGTKAFVALQGVEWKNAFTDAGNAIVDGIKRNWVFCVVVLVFGALCGMHSAALKCSMQNIFLGWAYWNQTLSWTGRFMSISALMIVRLLVSNLFPFTSPAFAYLIAKSQPEGEEWSATLFLLVCSMPAGAVVPILDTIAYYCVGRWTKRFNDGECADGRKFDGHFLVTRLLAKMTDHLPFSFWVRPFFMEPAFAAAKKSGASPEQAAAAAVLAGHFMIWAGPATTMYQRLFIPDVITCIFIQPLGLFEDVAVVLATWAGQSPSDQKSAEIGLYIFMLLMNLMRFWSAYDPSQKRGIEHLTVMGLTVLTIVVRCFWRWPFPEGEVTTTTTTTLVPELCATEHSNVKAMMMTVAFVSTLAVLFRLVARVVKMYVPQARTSAAIVVPLLSQNECI
eukprot:TRINITY_DN7815_c0_g1_i4.p1 TRINITY_DN7815_c0_g1~~TRINITY_DN7815_c0_g1_i4.p1  ORF type:complete len:502 (-),score=63.26 TRINITY_DN7815_c0_g1_i4:63-1568(-)